MSKPNIVYILADDMGYGDVSCYNEHAAFKTPHLDRMADEGIVFTDAHAPSAVCTPSRYGILTGRYCWRSRLKSGVTFGYSPPLIEEDRMTVPSFLKRHGYSTACFGKWHLGLGWHKKGEKPENIDYSKPIANGPTAKGFDYFFGISASLDMPPYVYIENDRVTKVPDRHSPGRAGKEFWREGPIAPDFKHEEVLPTLTKKTVEYIADHAGRGPFFIYFPLPAPHTPILPTDEFKGKSGTNAYGDFCLQVDSTVGQVTAALEKHGIAKNTIVIFTADNGCSPMADFPELAKFRHNPSYHFRGHKADIYDGGHRVALIVRWPENIKPGRSSDEVVCLTDLLGTCAEIAGEQLPAEAGEDSVSNLPVWLNRPLEMPLREAVVHHSINGSFSIRQGKWKFELCPGSGGWSDPKPGQEPPGSPPIQLYDMDADVSERTNVHDKHPDVMEKLKALLTAYVKNGRSTPGAPQPNTGPLWWPQLNWLVEEDLRNQKAR